VTWQPLLVGGSHQEVSFDENSADVLRHYKEPRSNRTPVADIRTPDSRYVLICPGGHPFMLHSRVSHSERFCFYFPLHVATVSPCGEVADIGMRSWSGGVWKRTSVVPTIMTRIKEPDEPLGKKRKKGRRKAVNIESESAPFHEAGLKKDTEAYWTRPGLRYQRDGW